MQKVGGTSMVIGLLLTLAMLVLAVLSLGPAGRDGTTSLPLCLAVAGAGLYVGGAIVSAQGRAPGA